MQRRTMGLSSWWPLAAWLIIIQAACAEGAGPSNTNAETAASRPGSVDRSETAAFWESIAPGIAMALADPVLRHVLLVEWRASEATEHKLEFPTFGRTRVGAAVLHRAAGHLGWDSASTLDRALRSSPVDFYVPGRTHRESWRATDDILVATNFRDAPRVAFDVAGNVQGIDPRSTGLPGRPIVMLQPAELKLVRPPTSRRMGETIQDAAEAEMQAAVLPGYLSGPTPRAVPNAQCTEETCGGGGGPHSVWTYLTFIQTIEICDNNFCDEGNEFEFDATSVATGMRSRLRITGVPSQAMLARNDFLIGSTPVMGGLINIQVRETDNFGDDDWLVVRYQPNYVGPVDLFPQALGAYFYLKENPYVGVFDPYRLVLKFNAH